MSHSVRTSRGATRQMRQRNWLWRLRKPLVKLVAYKSSLTLSLPNTFRRKRKERKNYKVLLRRYRNSNGSETFVSPANLAPNILGRSSNTDCNPSLVPSRKKFRSRPRAVIAREKDVKSRYP